MRNTTTTMKFELIRLSKVNKSDIIDLMNHPMVRRQMPLFDGAFTVEDSIRFVDVKEKLWDDFGFGPWAFIIDGRFAGWGGLQPENGEADLALVLHPNFWGCGRYIYYKILEEAFGDMGLTSITILLPISRMGLSGVFRLGFEEETTVFIKNVPFKRYRLHKKD